MAGTTTAAYTADVWTSISAVEGSQNQWDFAVPVTKSSTFCHTKSRPSHDSSHARSRDRASRGSRSSSLSRQAHEHDSVHPHSRGCHNVSRSSHEMGNHRAGNVEDSADTSYEGPINQGDMREGIGLYLNELDNENWIHRDKLAKIESEELHQAAILFQRRGLEPSRSQHGKNHDSQHYSSASISSVTAPLTTEALEPWPNLHDEPRAFSGSRAENRQHWDLRRPEEIAADDNAASFYQNPGLRKSSSRIPVSTASPVPISPEQLGREFPMQRARGLTNGDDDALSIGKPRRASEPIAVDAMGASTPPGGSRPGSRGILTSQNAQSKKTMTRGGSGSVSGPRKSSAPPAAKKIPSRSRATSSNQRPTTRSGETRPTQPINRPEGDPPWLATMYKPDPRLPPEQQMLPTHARKMQQEQWQKEGKTPTTYDCQFAPLAIGPNGPQPVEHQLEKKEEPPLPPPIPAALKPGVSTADIPPPPKSPEPNTRPSTGTGYSTMPKVQDLPPAVLTPKWSPPVVTAQTAPEKERSCGCCIVM